MECLHAWASLAGGALIGLAAAMFVLLNGVCGLSRLSARSLVATLVFMSAGFATVFVLRHLLDL